MLTRRVFEAIATARPARLFIAADGPADTGGSRSLRADARRRPAHRLGLRRLPRLQRREPRSRSTDDLGAQLGLRRGGIGDRARGRLPAGRALLRVLLVAARSLSGRLASDAHQRRMLSERTRRGMPRICFRSIRSPGDGRHGAGRGADSIRTSATGRGFENAAAARALFDSAGRARLLALDVRAVP